MSTCLIIGFYIGKRDSCTHKQAESYINIHLTYLKKIIHSLTKIIFVMSSDSIHTDKLDIKEEDNITYIYRRNNGLSFGSWCSVINYLKDTYDYYILCEDDYVFVQDNFDNILIQEYNNKDTEYMVTYKNNKGELSTIGILSSEVARNKHYFSNLVFINDKCKDMLTFLNNIQCISISEKYNMFPYWGYSNDSRRTEFKIQLYGYDTTISKEENKKRILLCCVQLLDDKLEINMNQHLYIWKNNDCVLLP
jgi:hypothetical protein